MSCLRSLVEGQLAGLHWDFRAGTVEPWQGEGDFLRAGELRMDPPARAGGRAQAHEPRRCGEVEHEDAVAAKSPDALARWVDLIANVERSSLRHGGVLAACERDEHCGG